MKRHAPATARNAEPLANVLASELPEKGLVLEIASGTGEHAVFLARRFPQLRWQPSDRDEGALDSIRAWASEAAAMAGCRSVNRLSTGRPRARSISTRA